CLFFFHVDSYPLVLPSFPTRRSSDLYFATGKLDIDTAAAVVGGIARGCEEAGCALIGGETAEMPDMYGVGEYDLAGFTVGAVEKDRKSTRLNSSHVKISYAVFCLKKK